MPGQISEIFELHADISTSSFDNQTTVSCKDVDDLAEERWAKADIKSQQWYEYPRANFDILGNDCTGGKSLSSLLLNVFKCRRFSRPLVGSFGNLFAPRFLEYKQ